MVPSSCDAGEEHLGSVRGVVVLPLPPYFAQSPERVGLRGVLHRRRDMVAEP
jgi:hypothetical protein